MKQTITLIFITLITISSCISQDKSERPKAEFGMTVCH